MPEVDATVGKTTYTSHRVSNVIRPAGWMVDRILAAPLRFPLKTDELTDHAVAIEQRHLAAINERQHVQINLRLWLVGFLIRDAVLRKGIGRPHPGIVVADDGCDPVLLQ